MAAAAPLAAGRVAGVRLGRVPETLEAAGAVVVRKGPQVLLVHRPKYDDWSFPKGKLDPGEHELTAAVREVAEETGLDIRLGPPLSPQSYEVGNGQKRLKRVHYWVGRVVGDDDVAAYRPNAEIDEVVWVDVDKAREQLSYHYDQVTLEEGLRLRKRSYPVVVLRHGHARSRKSWRGDDRERTLDKTGEYQAEAVVPLLAAYGVSTVLSSSSRRCWTTVAPYAEVADLHVGVTDGLSEEDATEGTVAEEVQRLLLRKEPSVLCTHRPVLPWVFAALGVPERPLEPGALFVAHVRNGRVVAAEHHDVPLR